MILRKIGIDACLAMILVAGFAVDGETGQVQMAVATFSQSILPMVVARQKGYYKAEDLDLNLILMTASSANMALMGGNVDFISSGPSAIGAIIRGAPLKFVFVCFNRPMHWLYAKPTIKDIRALRAKKIGVSAIGASTQFLIDEILKRNGLDPSRDVTFLGVGTTANRFAALKAGAIDATNLTPPFNFKAEEEGLRDLVAFVKQDYLVEPAGAIVVTNHLLESEPLLVEKVLRGTLKGLLYIRQNRAGTIPILAGLMKIQEDLAAKIYDLVLPGLTSDGMLNPEFQKKVLEFVTRVQGIKAPAPLDKVYDFAPLKKVRAELDVSK